ncbi:single-stranded DNA-binding protein mitochondrial [Phtheirospermum japonicum]|uniref:Single-stranded DNA-binding protein mitochondrial n=1 Tax=Phtheirospermum japonicum TaxID=374723 RepID=A0A830CIX5_9LAMI|nr:single-stranded DNA-binding protein mitochondrial [Phtheirospermum japonicum]
MASSLSKKLYGAIFSRYRPNPSVSNLTPLSFSTKSRSSAETESLSDSDSEPIPPTADFPPTNQKPANSDRPLENGLDLGIYKAILVGQLGQAPIQKKLRSGKIVTLLSLGTGGIRNNRRPLDNEEPRDYANRCAVQWHRVSIYPERLGELAVKSFVPGSILYVEGNLETKIFNDPITGLVRRIREVAVRRNGRVVSLGNGSDTDQLSKADISGVGYY